MNMDVKQVGMEKIDIAISQAVKGDAPSAKAEKVHIENSIRTAEKPEDGKKREVSEKEIQDMVAKSNKELVVFDRRLEYRIHEKTHEIMVKVINTTDDSVVREIPSEKMLDFVASLREKIGINMDERR